MTGSEAAITTEGDENLARTLGDAADDIRDMAPTEAGRVVQSRAQAAAPFVTGRLRASITTQTRPGVVSVGSDLPYAHVVHNGWAAHNISPNPFLIPVAEDSASIWGQAYVVDIDRINKQVKGA